MNGQWTARNEERVYESDELTVTLYDVTKPDDSKIKKHFVTAGNPTVGVVVTDPEKGVLLRWRHGLTSEQWGWEIPAGQVGNSEKADNAAKRIVLEQTGWQVGTVKKITQLQPFQQLLDHRVIYFTATDATWAEEGSDATEAADLSWIPQSQLPEILRKAEMTDGFSVTALLWVMQLELPRPQQT